MSSVFHMVIAQSGGFNEIRLNYYGIVPMNIRNVSEIRYKQQKARKVRIDSVTDQIFDESKQICRDKS